MLPHVGDAIMLFDSSWKMMRRSEIIKCWNRSECLGITLVNQNEFLLDSEQNSTEVDIDLTNNNSNQSNNREIAIGESLTCRILDGITDYRSYANDCNTPLNDTLAEVQHTVQQSDLINCLNSPAPFDEDSTKQNVTVGDMMDMYDNEDSIVHATESEPVDASQNTAEEVADTLTTLNSLSQVASDAKGITEDEAHIRALRIVQERVSALENSHDNALDK